MLLSLLDSTIFINMIAEHVRIIPESGTAGMGLGHTAYDVVRLSPPSGLLLLYNFDKHKYILVILV